MIKQFETSDLEAFTPNEFSNPEAVHPCLISSSYEVQTLWDADNVVKAILAFKNYWGRNWTGFFLVSERFDMLDAYELKKSLLAGLTARNVFRVQTESIANEKLRQWHEFLGFVHEGTRVKMMLDQDYDMWALMPKGA